MGILPSHTKGDPMKRPDHWFGTLAITIMLFLVPSVGQALPVGDVTCDGAVNVLDVVALVQQILNPG